MAGAPRDGRPSAERATILSVRRADRLQIEPKRERDRIVLRLRGELDLANSSRLRSELERLDIEPESTVVLDLREIEFMDSSGLRALLGAQELIEQCGAECAVTRGSEQVERLLRVTQASQYLQMIDSPAA
jgi:anti-sigma B factor antagonist